MHAPSAIRGHLLVIDGTPHAAMLVQMLEHDGFDCSQARGPMRVRALLEEQPVDLIVWREEPGNNELIRDILQECSRFPEIPIIHLFDRVLPSPSVARHPQIRESLPADSASARILSLLNRFFHRAEPEPAAPAVPRTELAFRNLVSTVIHHRNDSGFAELSRGGELHAPLTSVNFAERESLAASVQGSQPVPDEGWWQRLWRHWTRPR